MQYGKLAEFLTVLIVALVVGGAMFLVCLRLEGASLIVALVVIAAGALFLWQALRARFNRGG